MIRDFESHIRRKDLFSKKHRLLLAISGGMDSVVLADLLHTLGYSFALAHCNFNLRGKDSKQDENFCKKLARSMDVTFYSKSFDTKAYIKQHGGNIQLAARTLRYEWFNQIMREQRFDYLLTAHHANDVIETLILNLVRGTGIKGLKAIPEKSETIRRPLLTFSREIILTYAKQKKISYREDKSNAEDVYDRNFIRHHVVPKLQELNPSLEETFVNNIARFNEEAGMVNDYLEKRQSELLIQTHDSTFISKKKLQKEEYAASLLNYMLSGYGFNAAQQQSILVHLENKRLSGKLFHSASHRLTIDRNDLVIKANDQRSPADIKIQSLAELKKADMFYVSEEGMFSRPLKGELLVEPEQLTFPLTYRAVKTGDRFRPFGMKGFKLLSDFMKDQRFNLFQKESCRLLVNGNGDIVWVAGYQSDDRYRVNEKAKKFLKLKRVEH